MSKKLKMERSSGNVFADLGFAPGVAQNLKLRSDLMTRIERYVKNSGLTQKACAEQLGITQPRLNDLMRGKIDKFSLDALVNMAASAGMKLQLRVVRSPVRKAA